MNILDLPINVHQEIVKYLNEKQIEKLLLVSKEYKNLIMGNDLRLTMIFKDKVSDEYMKYWVNAYYVKILPGVKIFNEC